MQTCIFSSHSRGTQKRGHRARLKALQRRSAGFAGDKVDASVQSFFSSSAGDCKSAAIKRDPRQQAFRLIRRQLPSICECDGLDLKFNRPGGLVKKKSVTTMWRSSKSLFCCENRTADSAILFKVSMKFHWNLNPSFFLVYDVHAGRIF